MVGLVRLLACAVAIGGCAALESVEPAPTPQSATPEKVPVAVEASLNARVLELIATYPDQGFGGYAWPARKGTSGTTRDLSVGDDVIANGGDGNHCVGVTLEVFWRALAECPGGIDAALGGAGAPLAGSDVARGAGAKALAAARARAFKRVWYVPVDRGAGSAEALAAYRLGERVARLEDARPGDFMQAWRADGLGHSMVFMAWQRDEHGAITGVEYWSSQPWTDGIGRASTTIGVDEASFDPAQVYLARARCPTVEK
jgi:hypothetical protein